MRNVTDRALQEYLESLVEEPSKDSSERARELITSYAELQFRRTGGGRCQTCRATVRHVLPINVVRADGSHVTFDCLCHRCLQGERATAKSMEIAVGMARWVVKRERREKSTPVQLERRKRKRA